jgi:subtilase family serine protease
VPALAPGAASTGSTVLTLPAGTAVGSYYLLIRADADDAVAETVETNDTAAVPLQVGPDLIVSALGVPSTAGAGTAITVTDTTANQGSAPAAASTTALYLSTNSVLDASDVLLGSRAVPALAAGASSSGATAIAIPAATAAGTYFVLARADADDAVGETSEGNNTSVRVLQVGPDLIDATWSIPGAVTAGVPITVSDTVKNQGGGAADASTTRFYLSANALFDAADVPLGSRPVPALAPGATSTASTALTVPAGTPAGSYYLLIVADADGAVAETQEGNDLGLGPVVVSAANP